MKFKVIILIIFLFAILIVSFSLLSLSISPDPYVRLGLIFAGTALSGLLSMFIVRYILKPFLKLEQNILTLDRGQTQPIAATGMVETDQISRSYEKAMERLRNLQTVDDEAKAKTFIDSILEIKNPEQLSFAQEITRDPSLFCNQDQFYKTIQQKIEQVLHVNHLAIYLVEKSHIKPVWSTLNLDQFAAIHAPDNFLIAVGNREQILLQTAKLNEFPFLPMVKDYPLHVWIPIAFQRQLLGFITLLIDREAVLPEHISRFLVSFGREIGVCHRLLREYETIRANYLTGVKELATIWELWHPFNAGHAAGVETLALKIADQMNVSAVEKYVLSVSAYCHDIGELGIPDCILHKSEELTAQEMKTIRSHPLLSVEIIQRAELRHKIMDTVQYHHEHFDGNGYPHKITGTKIPLAARILTVCDAFQAMISTRPYRHSFNRTEAINMISEAAGTQFDPKVVEAFLAVIDTTRS